jgi:lipopolysaccharide export system permease protein
MKILDRYIIRNFLVTFVFTILALTVISVVIDSSEKADDFVKSGLSSSEIITKYYIGFVPFIISMIFPLMVFIAVIYFTSKLAGRSEIVAILANGVRYRRFLRPYFVGSIMLGGLLLYCNMYVFPRGNGIRSDFQLRYIDNNSSYYASQGGTNTFYLRSDTNTYIAIRYYDTTTKMSGGFFLQRLRGNKVIYNLRGESLKWDTARHIWKVQNAIEREINGLKETVKEVPLMDLKLSITPKDLRRDEYLKDKLTTPELKEFIHAEEMRGTEGLNTYKVEYYRRFATPVSVIILTLLGAVVASRKTRGGRGLHLAFGIVAAAVFVIMDRFSIVFSSKGNLHPMLAAWIPNLIFMLVTFGVYRKAPK